MFFFLGFGEARKKREKRKQRNEKIEGGRGRVVFFFLPLLLSHQPTRAFSLSLSPHQYARRSDARLRPRVWELADREILLDAAGERERDFFLFHYFLFYLKKHYREFFFSHIFFLRRRARLDLSLCSRQQQRNKNDFQAASSSVADIVNTALSTAASATAGVGGAVRRGAATADALYAAYRNEYCAPAQYVPSAKMPANFTSEFFFDVFFFEKKKNSFFFLSHAFFFSSTNEKNHQAPASASPSRSGTAPSRQTLPPVSTALAHTPAIARRPR